VLGAWGYFVGEVNLAISVVGAMVLGIVVDDTIYILTRYIDARRAGSDVRASLQAVFEGVGLSLLATSVVIAAGFAVLATSSFAVNANLGLLAAGAVVMALIYDFLFMPALLLAFSSRRIHVNPMQEA
jgi:predicted RND superfamily exporter protein